MSDDSIRSEARFRQLFKQHSAIMLLVDPVSCKILDANKAAAEFYGYSRNELRAMTIRQISILPSKEIFSILKQVQDRTINHYIVPHRLADGSIRLVEVHSTPIPFHDQSLDFAIIHDITERKKAEEALQQSERDMREAKQLLELVLETIPVRLFWKDLKGVFLGCNRLFAEDSGYKNPEELIGFDDYSMGWKEQAEMYRRDDFEVMRSGKPKLHYEEIQNTPDGKQIWLSTSKVPLRDTKGEIIGILGAYEDITQRKWAEEQLKTANEDLERRVEQRTRELLETQKQYLHVEKLSAIGKLSASIAHEFNNPLQGVLSTLKGLKKRAILAEEDRQLLDAAITESERMKNLIRSLQDFNRPSSGRRVMMDVHESLDALLLLHKSDFRGKRITVERDYAGELPLIMAVRDQIKQVFLNLLTNAADACPRSGGVITVSTWQENDHVAVAIKDTGAGIKPEEMEHIFRPFYTTKPEVKGTGLGLSVSYGIVKQHNGEIRVDSQLGKGTTFTILLPCHGGNDAVSVIDQ